jgi:Ca-activated chloride channel family protein
VSFAAPLALLGLLAIPLLVGVYLLAGRRQRRAAGRFANPALVPNLVSSLPAWRRYVPFALALAALALLVVGIARPHVVRSVTRDEATIVLAIDTSRSMEANDVRPSRFAAAQAAARDFLDAVPEAYRVGIVSFSTGASTVLTPTTDREAAKTALGELRLGSGTAIGNAIARSAELASADEKQVPRSGDRSPAAVLLLSDGAQTAGGMTPEQGVVEARKLGIPVSTVALGRGDAVVEVSARPPPPLDGMQPMNGWNAVVRRPVPAYTAVNSTSRPVVTPGPTGAPFSPRKLTSIERSLTLASTPATM